MKKINRNPTLLNAYNDGIKKGRQEAIEEVEKIIDECTFKDEMGDFVRVLYFYKKIKELEQ